MSSSPFCDILTTYGGSYLRDINSQAAIYEDMGFLTETIRQLVGKHLEPSQVNGKRVLLKPNWVRHQLKPNDRFALCTNENFILALLDVILAYAPAKIVVGDAPVQGCKWQNLLSSHFLNDVESRSRKSGIPIFLKDFRRVVFDAEANDLTQAKDNLDEFVIFDVGVRSFLEPVTHPKKNLFRVTVYNPDRFVESHRPGVHRYCITRELFDADLVISIPKVKTHQKAGITAALKNIVGINGDKDFLPHHRLGGDQSGGDCYPGDSKLRYLAEICLDNANRKKGEWQYKLWVKLGSMLWRLSRPGSEHQMAAGWHGNDTTWRMVMDLNLILKFGMVTGELSDTPQRVMYSLCDGIIGGQGDGPLDPTPLPLGVILFSNNSALNDLCCAKLMRMDTDRIPLLVAASNILLTTKGRITLDGRSLDVEELMASGIETEMPPGWLDYRSKGKVADFARLMAQKYQSVSDSNN